MPWSYRVVHEVVDGEDCFGIHEAYFEDGADAHSVSENLVRVSAENLRSLRCVLVDMFTATLKPVLEMAEMKPKEGEEVDGG